MKTKELATFEPFADETAYIRVNDRMIRRIFRRLRGSKMVRLLDLAAATGLISRIALDVAKDEGMKLDTILLDIDLPALQFAQTEPELKKAQFLFASADALPLNGTFDIVILANSLHLLDDNAKENAMREIHRVLRPGGVFAINSTFYGGAYPEESKPFYSRWMRRAIPEMNRRLPGREKSEKAQAMEWLEADAYRSLIECHGFKVVEQRERRVLLSQAAVRAISSYVDFAKGALHATDEDAAEASRALQVTVKQTFNDLKMKYLPRNWLEIIAVKP
jgi:ubiquinone/menaquinone biosynthesis C-methylase UbiE